MVDYLSRHPTEWQGASLKAESLWNEWFTVNSVSGLKDVLEDGEVSSEASQASKAKQIKREVKERNSVNRVSEAKSRGPIKSEEARNPQDLSKPQFDDNYW